MSLYQGGIDKIEVCVPITARFADSFLPIYREARNRGSFQTNRRYFSSLDLRPYCIDAILHEHSRFPDRNGDRYHKLELISVGGMTAQQIVDEVTSVFDEPLSRFRVYRVDFFLDLPEITVDELRQRLLLKYKRTSGSYGLAMPEREQVLHRVETITLGIGPDLLRCYDKTAERRHRYAKQQRLAKSKAIEIDSFIQTFGHDEDAVVTRVERQVRGRSVPAHLRTLENLLLNAPDCNPFARVEIVAGKQQPRIHDYDVATYLQGRGLAAMIADHGLGKTRRLLNGNRNASRMIKKLEDFIPGKVHGLTIPDLGEAFRSAAKKQLQVKIDPSASPEEAALHQLSNKGFERKQ